MQDHAINDTGDSEGKCLSLKLIMFDRTQAKGKKQAQFRMVFH